MKSANISIIEVHILLLQPVILSFFALGLYFLTLLPSLITSLLAAWHNSYWCTHDCVQVQGVPEKIAWGVPCD